MSTKRQPSKQRRQTQNQRARAARNARREAAAATQVPAAAAETRSAPPAKAGSVLTRLRGAGPAGRQPDDRTPVGHRAALSALLAAIAAAVVGALLLKVPVDRQGEAIATREALVAEWALSAAEVVEEQPDASPAEIAAAVDDWLPGGSRSYGQAYWPMSVSLLLPVLGTGLGVRAVARRSPAKLVNRTMYITLFGALLTFQLSLVFLPAVIGLAVAGFQVRRAEMATAQVIDLDAEEAVDEPQDAEIP